MKWTAQDIPSLHGKTALVTGANSGLGYETTLALARKGAEVVMACRNHRKAEDAAGWIRDLVPGAKLSLMHLDLSSLQIVREFSSSFLQSHPTLDILINNAGLSLLPLRRTAEGFEMQLGTNHFGHFALTGLLLPALKAAPDARIVTVSSIAHKFGKMDFDDLNWEKSYSKWPAYGRSKLANLLFAQELHRRLQKAGSPIKSLAAHPGYASTQLLDPNKGHGQSKLANWFFGLGNNVMAQSQEMGALPQLYAATAPEAKAGAYYGPDGWFAIKGYPREEKPHARLCNPRDALRLWERSEALTGVQFGI
jgi:NAD(P)-dependent dehydrogenase (short-subunit alcohol dehydrogenase family)